MCDTIRHRASSVTLAVLLVAALVPAAAQAQEDESPYGIGFQSAWPAYGLSGLYDMSERFTAQAVLGALGTATSLAGRGIYRFSQKEKYNWFGFGSVGLWRYAYTDCCIGGNTYRSTESSVGIGGGVGIELDWGSILDDEEFPPLYSNFELGLQLASFDYYNFSALGFGGGLHYRF